MEESNISLDKASARCRPPANESSGHCQPIQCCRRLRDCHNQSLEPYHGEVAEMSGGKTVAIVKERISNLSSSRAQSQDMGSLADVVCPLH